MKVNLEHKGSQLPKHCCHCSKRHRSPQSLATGKKRNAADEEKMKKVTKDLDRNQGKTRATEIAEVF